MPRKKPQGGGLSQRAYARRRGVTHSAVQKALRTGRISALADGTIDPRAADRQWAANTDETKPLNSVSGAPKHRRRPGDAPGPVGGEGGNGEPEGRVSRSYQAARTMREVYTARRAKLDLEVAEGKLVPVEEVRAHAFDCARRVRDAVLAVPDRLAPVLAGMTDTEEVRRELRAELRKALAELGAEEQQDAARAG